MINYIGKLLYDENIEYFGALPLNKCRIKKPHLLPPDAVSALVFLVPYYVDDKEKNQNANISLYARSLDYHLYFDILSKRLKDRLQEKYPNKNFYFFCDHSPIDEVDAAIKCNLGVLGKNMLLINNVYKSYVFIGEILLCDKVEYKENKINSCLECNKCINCCDVLSYKSNNCLSCLTQTKVLNDEQREILKNHKLIWGCDNCQNICPMCKDAKETPIEFFHKDRICNLDFEALNNMSENDFKNRAFAWKGKDILYRNIELLYSQNKS